MISKTKERTSECPACPHSQMHPSRPQSPMRHLYTLQDPGLQWNTSVPCKIPVSTATCLAHQVPPQREAASSWSCGAMGLYVSHLQTLYSFLSSASYWTKWGLLCSHLFWWWVQSCTGNEQVNILKRECDLKGCYLLNVILALSAEGSESVTRHSEGEKQNELNSIALCKPFISWLHHLATCLK